LQRFHCFGGRRGFVWVEDAINLFGYLLGRLGDRFQPVSYTLIRRTFELRSKDLTKPEDIAQRITQIMLSFGNPFLEAIAAVVRVWWSWWHQAAGDRGEMTNDRGEMTNDQ